MSATGAVTKIRNCVYSMSNNKTLRILVLCTGNSCRSQMAEGFFRYYGGDCVEVHSAGLEPKGVNPIAIQVMYAAGIDISTHSSDHVSNYVGQSFDYVITVCNNAAAGCPVFPGAAAKLHWPFDDPAEAIGTDEYVLAKFSRVRDQIGIRIKVWLKGQGLTVPNGPDIGRWSRRVDRA